MKFGRVRAVFASSIGSRLVLVVSALLLGMGVHSVISHDRTESAMHGLMLEKGGALISSLESGLRSNRRGGMMRVDFLLEEIAGRPDVQFVALTGPDGFILRHSNPERIGEVLALDGREFTARDMDALAPGSKPRWHLLPIEWMHSFVMYKSVGQVLVGPRMESGSEYSMGVPTLTVPVTLFVGLDPGPLFLAREEDWQRLMLAGGGALVCLLLGLFALYWARKAHISSQGQQAAEALSDNMMLSLPDGLILLDPHGALRHVNAIAQRWLCLGAADLGKSAAAVLPPGLAGAAARLLERGNLADTEIELPGEEPLPVSVRGSHVETPETGRLGSLLLLRDQSERKRLEGEIRRREKLAAVGNLAAGVAHEIRNPLSSIKGYATYFGERFAQGSEDREAARVMVGEVDRLNRVISDLLDLARPAQLALKPTDPAALIDDTLRLVQQDAARRGITVRLVNEAPGLMPELDPDRMRQVVLNLCLNAFDAMPDGGELMWRLKAAGEYVLFEAADTGIGIAPDVLPTIFDPYFTTKGHGTGLGLATVHKIIEAHGGHILVTSTPGAGTMFRVFVPLRTGEEV